MGFQLVIATGKEAGREFVFDQASILIGRTADCDVILYEAGVSRQHARIFAEDGAFMVEDMGSSNGTQVNGATVQKVALKTGDAITLGPVVFNFSEMEDHALGDDQPATGEMPAHDPNAGNHTRVVNAAELKRSRNKGVAMLPRGASADELKSRGEARTQALPVLRGSNPNGRLAPKPSVPPPPARFRTTSSGISRRPPVALDTGDDEVSSLTAADRARIRRESGAAATFKIFWADASKPVRTVIITLGALVGLGLLGGLVYEVLPKDTSKKRIEPTSLDSDTIKDSFGYGEGVVFSRPDEKTFSFEVQSPVAALVILHFMSSDI